MTITFKEFASQTVDAVGETIYTAVAGDKITELHFCNVTSSDATIEVWRVKNGESASNNNKKLNGMTIPANDSLPYAVEMGMAVNDFIYAKCGTADAICIAVSGVNNS